MACGLPAEEILMRCERCNNGERRGLHRARLAERHGRTAVVLDVPVEECPSCAEIWLSMEVAVRLDALFNQLLAGGAESSRMHWDQADAG